MVRPAALTDEQRTQIRHAEKQLRKAAKCGNLAQAKAITARLQPLLRSLGHETRLQKAKAWMFEAALEAGAVQYATTGFQGIRKKTAKSTRIYLEATSLLAVCYLRLLNLEKAEPLIAEAYMMVKNISSRPRRRQFYRRMLERFEDEWALAVL